MKISLIVALILILAGCAQAPKTIPVENPEQVWRLHATYLYNHHVWQASMSVIGATSEEKFKTRLNWNQKKDSYEIRLRDFIGRTVAVIDGSEDQVSAKTSKGKTYQGESAEELLDKVAGLRIPLEGMRYWLRGLPEPGDELESFVLGDQGVPESIEQNGWQMSYPTYHTYGDLMLPKQVLLTYDDLKLTVNINDWDIKTTHE
ncbi:MAG: lipoprotein insertase outer membrane protein LolB [Pseudomonadota bacterium]